MHFSKKLCHLSSAGPEIAAFGSHCSVSFTPLILNWFVPNVKLEYKQYKIPMLCDKNVDLPEVSTFCKTSFSKLGTYPTQPVTSSNCKSMTSKFCSLYIHVYHISTYSSSDWHFSIHSL